MGWILINIPTSVGGVPPVYYLRTASRLESIYSNDYAAQLYRRVYDLFPTAADTEAALFRLGRINEQANNNPNQARAIYMELLRLFPHGAMAMDAQRALTRLGAGDITRSWHNP